MKKIIRAVPGIILTVCLLWTSAGADGMQACHRVTNTAETTTLENKAQVELWHVETVLPEVTDEINGLAEAWAEEIGPTLKAAGNNGKRTANWTWISVTAGPG